MRWDIDVSIYGNSHILRELIFGFGLACGIPGALFALIDGNLDILVIFGYAFIGFMVVGWLGTLIFYGGKNKLNFSLNDEGVVNETRKEQAKKSRIINILLIIIGIFSRKPTYAGIGVMGEARGYTESARWKDVKKVEYKPKSRTIILRCGGFHKIMVFCLPENYMEVAEYVQIKMQRLICASGISA